MCFDKKLSDGVLIKLAKVDIPVYKVIKKNGRGWMYSLYIDGAYVNWEPGFEYEELTPLQIVG